MSDILLSELNEKLLDAINKFKGGFLIIDRAIKGDFLSIFKDSLYNYRDGILLIERFYKKEKCKIETRSFSYAKEDDLKVIEEFKEFSKNALTDKKHSHEEIQKKINDYEKKIEKINKEYSVVDLYSYKNKNLLIDLNNMPDEAIEALSKIYTNFILGFYSTITWTHLDSVAFSIATIDNEDFIDLVIFPFQQKEE